MLPFCRWWLKVCPVRRATATLLSNQGMPTQTEGVGMSVHTSRESEGLRPLHEFQAGLGQFLDVPSRKRVLIAKLPYGKAFVKQAPDGAQGQAFDVVVVNDNGAFCFRAEKDRRELRRFLDRDGHELRVRRGQIGEDWPSRVAEVRP